MVVSNRRPAARPRGRSGKRTGIGALIAALSVGVAMAGCSGSGSVPAHHDGSTTTIAPASARCPEASVTITKGTGLSGGGNEGVVLVFHNTGSPVCSLSGYPSIVVTTSGGQRVQPKETVSGYLGGVRAGTHPGHLPVVDLNRGQAASAMLESVDNSATAPCPTFAEITVGMPGGSPSTTLSAALPGEGTKLPDCGETPQIHPIVPGVSGSSP
jgi:Protein of unknown function (DUF4232)